MKFIVIGLLLWFVPIMSASAQHVQISEHRLIPLEPGLKKAMSNVGRWEDCGRYFSAVETSEGKFIHFSYEKDAPANTSPKSVPVPIGELIRAPFINESMATPMVFVLGDYRHEYFALAMNLEDYKRALPCISNGNGLKI